MEELNVELLRKIELLNSLNLEELQDIRSKMIIRKFKKNETILYEEDTNKFMYAILDGRVKVVKTTEDGKEIILAMHKSGDSFGEISMIDGKTTTAAVQATDNSVVAIISKENFQSVLYSQKKFVDGLLKMLCSRIRENVDKIQMLNFNNASQRIKMLFIKLSQQYGEKTPDGIIMRIKLTHQDLASMTGLTRETVTRVVDIWQKNGYIVVSKDRSILLSSNFLEDVTQPFK